MRTGETIKWVIVGHRGVGKTAFLSRLQVYWRKADVAFLDLDAEIERRHGAAVGEIFPRVGEARFREIEREVFAQLVAGHSSFVIAVGGGFQIDAVERDGIEVIWLRRNSDETGRVFLDRPRLNPNVPRLAEFKDRYASRQKLYQSAATEIHWLPEGLEGPHPVENRIWGKASVEAGGILTLQPWHFRSFRFLRYGCDFYEVRDDLLNSGDRLWESIPRARRLLSVRDPRAAGNSLTSMPEFALTDWALELGPCPEAEVSIISAHERLRDETIAGFLDRLESAGLPHQHLKAAPVVETWAEAKALIDWQSKEPDRRSILPRSPSGCPGRWTWLRLYMKGRQKLSFWRDGDGSAGDQPTLFEWLSTSTRASRFAALLGDPVAHSRTMVEQSEFFADRGWPVWAVRISAEEFTEGFTVLESLGLRAAAVTSPLKIKAFEICTRHTPVAAEIGAVNCIGINGDDIVGHNTDLEGFENLLKAATHQRFQSPAAIIWGGGGTLPIIKKVLPGALELSVRSGKPRDPKGRLPQKTDLLIWAAGPEAAAPPHFEFGMLIDLNYRADSNARELAAGLGKPYVDGMMMFKAQAAGQRRFWSELFNGKPGANSAKR